MAEYFEQLQEPTRNESITVGNTSVRISEARNQLNKRKVFVIRNISDDVTKIITVNIGYGTASAGQSFAMLDTGTNYFGGYSADLAGTHAFSTTVFEMHTIVYDSGVIKLYVNGVLDTSGSLSLNTSGTTIYIGCRFDGSSCMTVALDEVSLYSGPLSAGDITALYAFGSGSVNGCTDPEADNYNASATVDDGSCHYPLVILPIIRTATTTCSRLNATDTQCISEYIPEITYQDFLFTMLVVIFCLSFLAYGVLFSPLKKFK